MYKIQTLIMNVNSLFTFWLYDDDKLCVNLTKYGLTWGLTAWVIYNYYVFFLKLMNTRVSCVTMLVLGTWSLVCINCKVTRLQPAIEIENELWISSDDNGPNSNVALPLWRPTKPNSPKPTILFPRAWLVDVLFSDFGRIQIHVIIQVGGK